MSLIYNFFNDLEYILVDPTNYMGDQTFMSENNINIINEKYNDETYQKINELNKSNKKIIIMFNLEYKDTKKEILEQLMKQELWCTQLNVVGYNIKIRIPNEKINKKDMIINNVKMTTNNDYENFYYLAGEKYLPIYNNPDLYELNIMDIRGENEQSFKKESYDLEKLKKQLNYYNYKDRKTLYIFGKSDTLKYNLLGYDDGYESVTEYNIIYNLMNILKKNNENNKNNKNIKTNKILKILYNINKYYLDILQTNLVLCVIKTSIENIKNMRKNNEVNENLILDDIELLFIEYIQIVYSLKEQISNFTKGTMMEEEKYEFQIELIKEIIDKLNEYMKDLLKMDIVKKSKNYYQINKIINELDSYLKYFIVKGEFQEYSYQNNMGIIMKIRDKKKDKKLNEQNMILIQLPILNLFKELDKLKEENPHGMQIVDKKDYFFL